MAWGFHAVLMGAHQVAQESSGRAQHSGGHTGLLAHWAGSGQSGTSPSRQSSECWGEATVTGGSPLTARVNEHPQSGLQTQAQPPTLLRVRILFYPMTTLTLVHSWTEGPRFTPFYSC